MKRPVTARPRGDLRPAGDPGHLYRRARANFATCSRSLISELFAWLGEAQGRGGSGQVRMSGVDPFMGVASPGTYIVQDAGGGPARTSIQPSHGSSDPPLRL